MNELKVFEYDHVDVLDSRQVAEMIEKDHAHLMRDIAGYAKIIESSSQTNFGLADFFIPSTYKDAQGKDRPCYLLTKKGCDMVANKTIGRKGVLFTAAYVTAFEAMRNKETMMVIPKDYPSALRALADAEEAKLKLKEQNQALLAENEQQRQTIADFEPVRQYVDVILESTGVMATTQIAADYGLSAKALNRILHEAGVQHKVNGQWILYREHMGKGYTDSKTFPITRRNGMKDSAVHTYWTQKGRLMIHNILTDKGIKALMDRKEG